MAELDPIIPDDDGWEDVTTEFQRTGGARREPPAAVVWPTGLAPFNTESSRMLMLVVSKAGLTPNQFSVRYRVNSKKGLVAVLPARETEPVKIGVVRNEGRYSLHLGPVFEEYPNLRPVGKRKCIVYIDKRTGYLTISLHTGQAMQTESRSGDEQQAQ